MPSSGRIPALDKRYWERLVKRQITDAEFGAAAAAVLNDRFRDRRRKKRAGLKAIRESKRKRPPTEAAYVDKNVT
jgi:hypothetical protein